MKNPQDIPKIWHAFMYIVNIPFVIFLLYFALNPKALRKRDRSPRHQHLSDSDELFVRIVFVIGAILIIAVLIKMP